MTDKITPLAENVYLCRSGSAADTQAISAYVQWFLQQHAMDLDRHVNVKTAAKLAQTMVYQNKVILPGQISFLRLLKQVGRIATDLRPSHDSSGWHLMIELVRSGMAFNLDTPSVSSIEPRPDLTHRLEQSGQRFLVLMKLWQPQAAAWAFCMMSIGDVIVEASCALVQWTVLQSILRVITVPAGRCSKLLDLLHPGCCLGLLYSVHW